MKDDDKIRDLFGDFQPNLSNSQDFISTTIHRLEGYDLVKSQLVRRNRIFTLKCILSAVIGFISGMIMTFFFTYINDFIRNVLIMISTSVSMPEIEIAETITWCFISIFTLCAVFISYTVLPNFSNGIKV